MKVMKVANIGNGVTVDHIPAGKALKCLRVIAPPDGTMTTLGINVNSTKLGRKDFIKMENVVLDKDMTDKIALIAPTATINIIRNFKIVKKWEVKMPAKISGTIFCINPGCASRVERYLTPCFTVEKVKPLRLKCDYCERCLFEEDVLSQLK